jgi:hypothetical protein
LPLETTSRRKGTTSSASSTRRKEPLSIILYPAKISFRNEGGVKTFPDAGELKDLLPEDPP